MKYVSTAELKAKLSHYLTEVREGGTLYVTSHGKAVAELLPVTEPATLEIHPPQRPISDLEGIGVPMGRKTPAEEQLLEDRGRR